MNVSQQIDRAVSRYGDNVFAMCDGREATLRAVDVKARALARSLFRLGVQKGDRVVVLLENSINCIEVDFGLARGGYVRVSMNPRITEREAAKASFKISGFRTLNLALISDFEIVNPLKLSTMRSQKWR